MKPSVPIAVGGRAKRSDSHRLKLLAGTGIAVLLGVLVLPRALGGDDGGEALSAATEAPATPEATASSPAVDPAPSPAGKNPFGGPGALVEPVVEPGTTAVTGTVPPAPPTGALVTGAVLGTGSTGSTVASDLAATATTTTTTASVPPVPAGPDPRFFLLEVLDPGAEARVRVDDQVLQVGVNQTFGGSFRVISLDVATRCGTFLYGDRRFPLCEGEEAFL